jgi:hypothetical protein
MSEQQPDQPKVNVPPPPPRQPDEDLKGYIERGNEPSTSSDRGAPSPPSR